VPTAAITVSARVGSMIVDSARAAGVDQASLRVPGWDPTLAGDPDARIAIETEDALWEEAARRTGDEAFGLHTAERLRPGHFDTLDYAIRTSATVRDAVSRLARYNRLVHDVAVFEVAEDAAAAVIEHRFHGVVRGPHRHAAEFTLASLLVVGAQMSGAPARARAVSFTHPSPKETGEHLRLFGVNPKFGADRNALTVAREFLDRRMPGADPGLSAVLDRHAQALLAALPAPVETSAGRLRHLLAGVLRDGEPTLAAMARQSRMSERSLQRRLAAEETSFEAVLDELRHELAVRYLADPRVAIAEVAFLLGYSEPSAFHRAFRRWTDRTPAEQRRQPAAGT
jgi:AraC-like DNA-binding protein